MKQDKKSLLNKYVGRILITILTIFILYNIIRNSIFIPYLSKNNPTCTKAIIAEDYYSGRYIGRRLAYEFIYLNKVYKGNFKNNNLKIGDSVCVVFLKANPAINKPLSFFNDEDIKCNCSCDP
jgi:hypothetical protein